MAFTESLPIAATGIASSGGGVHSGCATAGGNMLTDNGTLGIMKQVNNGDGSITFGACYAPNLIEVTRFQDITIPAGATITGVRFTVEANGVLTDASDALQYQVTVNSGTDYTTAAALDLTGINNTKGGVLEFHTTSGTTELHGLTWPTSDSDYDSPDVRFKFTLNSGEADGKILQVDFVKLRVYYDEVAVDTETYSPNGETSFSISSGKLVVSNGIIKVKG